MPKLNRTGELWAAGIAGAGFSCGTFKQDGRPKVVVEVPGGGNAGGRAFLNDAEALTVQHDAAEIRAYDCRTGRQRVVHRGGASEIDAGGDAWAVFLAGGGVRTSSGLHLPSAYVGASTGPARNDCFGPDGSVAIKAEYHSFGPWHIYRADGSRAWLLTPGDAANIQLLGGERAIWREGWTWHARGVPVPEPLIERAWSVKLLETPEGWWLVYFGEYDDNVGLLVAHPNGSDHGYVIAHTGLAYGIDAAITPAGALRVVYATTEGEVSRDLVAHTLDFAAPRERISFDRPPVVVPPVVIPPAPEDPPVSTPDHSEIVRAVGARFPHLLERNTKADAGELTERAVLALAEHDPEWGHVRKPNDGRNGYRGHAVDAIKYKSTGQVVDIILKAGDEVPTSVGWDLKPSRDDEPWMLPILPGTGGDAGDPGDENPEPEDPSIGEQLEALRRENTMLAGELSKQQRKQAEQAEQLALIEAAIDELAGRRPVLPELVARGKVSIAFGISKSVELPVVPK